MTAPQQPEPHLLDASHRAFTIGIVSFILLVAFEGVAVITALPVVAADLGSVAIVAWGLSAFVAASLVGQVLAGKWGDRLGPRIPLLCAIAAFGTGAVVAGLANGVLTLLIGRALQGVGAGAMIVSAYVIIGRAYAPSLRPRAFAILSAAWVLPAIVGPPVAGWLADSYSWRWVFLAAVVLMWPPLLLLVRHLRAFDGPAEDAMPRRGRVRAGMVAAVALLLVQEGAQRGGAIGVGLVVLGMAALVPALRALMPRRTLLLGRGLPTVIAMRGLLAGAFFGAEAWIPLALATVRGISTAGSGAFLAAGAIGWAAGAWLQGHAPRGWTAPRFVMVGAVLVVASLLSTTLTMLPWFPPVLLGVTWALGAAGMGMAVSSLATLLLEYSSVGEQGGNSAALQVSDSTGVVLITSFTSIVVVSWGPGPLVFTIAWCMAAAVAVVAVAVSPRVRARS